MSAARPHRGAPHERIPLNTWAIAFGTAGLAEAWSEADRSLGWWPVVSTAWWLVTLVVWAWLLVAHLLRGRRTGLPLGPQLRHPAQGPTAAIVPVVAILLGAQLAAVSLLVARAVVLLGIVATVLFLGWLLAGWLTGGLEVGAVHGGYLLPAVAAGLVGADAAAAVGLQPIGWALFASGCFFWVVVTSLLLLRFAVGPPLPDPLVPTMSILMAPPAVAGLAWATLVGPEPDPVGLGLAGLTVVMVVVQLALLPRYARLPFSLGFWSFTFPSAAVVTVAVQWLEPAGAARTVPTIALLVLLTAFVLAIAVRSVVEARRQSEARLETAFVRADDDAAAEVSRDPALR